MPEQAFTVDNKPPSSWLEITPKEVDLRFGGHKREEQIMMLSRLENNVKKIKWTPSKEVLADIQDKWDNIYLNILNNNDIPETVLEHRIDDEWRQAYGTDEEWTMDMGKEVLCVMSYLLESYFQGRNNSIFFKGHRGTETPLPAAAYFDDPRYSVYKEAIGLDWKISTAFIDLEGLESEEYWDNVGQEAKPVGTQLSKFLKLTVESGTSSSLSVYSMVQFFNNIIRNLLNDQEVLENYLQERFFNVAANLITDLDSAKDALADAEAAMSEAQTKFQSEKALIQSQIGALAVTYSSILNCNNPYKKKSSNQTYLCSVIDRIKDSFQREEENLNKEIEALFTEQEDKIQAARDKGQALIGEWIETVERYFYFSPLYSNDERKAAHGYKFGSFQDLSKFGWTAGGLLNPDGINPDVDSVALEQISTKKKLELFSPEKFMRLANFTKGTLDFLIDTLIRLMDVLNDAVQKRMGEIEQIPKLLKDKWPEGEIVSYLNSSIPELRHVGWSIKKISKYIVTPAYGTGEIRSDPQSFKPIGEMRPDFYDHGYSVSELRKAGVTADDWFTRKVWAILSCRNIALVRRKVVENDGIRDIFDLKNEFPGDFALMPRDQPWEKEYFERDDITSTLRHFGGWNKQDRSLAKAVIENTSNLYNSFGQNIPELEFAYSNGLGRVWSHLDDGCPVGLFYDETYASNPRPKAGDARYSNDSLAAAEAFFEPTYSTLLKGGYSHNELRDAGFKFNDAVDDKFFKSRDGTDLKEITVEEQQSRRNLMNYVNNFMKENEKHPVIKFYTDTLHDLEEAVLREKESNFRPEVGDKKRTAIELYDALTSFVRGYPQGGINEEDGCIQVMCLERRFSVSSWNLRVLMNINDPSFNLYLNDRWQTEEEIENLYGKKTKKLDEGMPEEEMI